MIDYISIAIPILERNKKDGYHIKQLAEIMIDEHPNIKISIDELAEIINQKLYVDSKKKSGARFARVKNLKTGSFKRGVYRLKQVKKTPRPPIAISPKAENIGTQFTGAGGEHAVLSELLFRGFNAGIMTVDEGIDIVASKNNNYHHIQVKTSYDNGTGFTFTIKNKAFDKNSGSSDFYIFLCRIDKKSHFINEFIVLPSFAIQFYIDNETLKPNASSIHIGLKIDGNKFILAGKEDVTAYLNAFHKIK